MLAEFDRQWKRMNAKAEKKIEFCEKADAKQILEAVLILRRQLLKEDEMKLIFMAKQKFI